MSGPAFSSLLLVGCGRMGSALLGGWLNNEGPDKPQHVAIVEPGTRNREDASRRYGILGYDSIEAIDKGFRPDLILFAVKPQSLDATVPAYAARFGGQKPVILSIAAGKTLAYFVSHFGADARIIRAMPNTPALIHQGITVACANKTVTDSDRQAATRLLDKVGLVEWVDDEELMNAVTALSGSGPAYMFLFLECLMKAGIDAGLGQELARKLVMTTARGSVELALSSKDELASLREHVTSKGGTTEAALQVFRSGNKLESLVKMAVYAAMKRAQELA